MCFFNACTRCNTGAFLFFVDWGFLRGRLPFFMFICPLDKKFVMPVFTNEDAFKKSRNFKNVNATFDPSNNYGFYTDDDYLASISQYKDKPFYNHLLENPWLAGNQGQFSPNLWQQIGEELGDTQARDKYNADLRSQRSQWLAERLRQYEQQDYDSALAQVGRERQAGLNPDLNGNITPGSSAENDQPSGSVDMSSESGTSEILQLGNTILSTAIQFYSGLVNIRGASLDNRLKSLNLTQNLKSSAWDAISESVGEIVNSQSTESLEALFDKSTGKFVDSFTKAVSDRVGRLPFSTSNKRAIKRMINDLIYSTDSHGSQQPSARFEKLKNDILTDLSKSRNEYTKAYGLPGARADSNNEMRAIATTIYKPINDLALEVDKLFLQHNKSYQSRAVATGLGSLRADSEFSSYRMKSDLFNIKNKVVSAFKRINEKITGSKDISPTWKIALEAGVSSAEAIILNKLAIQ